MFLGGNRKYVTRFQLSFEMSTTRRTSCRRRRYGPFDTFGHSLAEIAAPDSSGLYANICLSRHGHRFDALTDPFDEEQHRSARPTPDPETLLLQTDDATLIARAMRTLPDFFHQLLVRREFEGLSYESSLT